MKREARSISHLLTPIVIFASGILLTCMLAAYSMWSASVQERKLALHTAEVYGARIEKLLESLFHKTDILNAILIENEGKLEQQTFLRIAETLDDGAGIRAVQCLPDGIVQYCYPLEGNEAAIGDNVFDNPKRRTDALLALETKSIALSGPYELIQGGFGLIARNPVFLKDKDGKEAFWGFSVIILDLPEAIEPITLKELSTEGYSYRLHCVIDTGEDRTIAENGTLKESDSISYTIHVPNHEWTLTLSLQNHKLHRRAASAILISGAIFSVLLASVFYQWSERERLRGEREQMLNKISRTDELTGIYNRRYLVEMMEEWCKDFDSPFGLLYMDLDHFKSINDTLGHHWGDVLLIEASHRIGKAIGEISTLARIGGDEFVAVIRCAGCDGGCDEFVENIYQEFENPFVLDHQPVTVGISVGCVYFPLDADSYDALMHIADQRMYEEKRRR